MAGDEMTDYIIIVLLALLVLDKYRNVLRNITKGLKHLLYRPFVRFAHWRHVRRINK